MDRWRPLEASLEYFGRPLEASFDDQERPLVASLVVLAGDGDLPSRGMYFLRSINPGRLEASEEERDRSRRSRDSERRRSRVDVDVGIRDLERPLPSRA